MIPQLKTSDLKETFQRFVKDFAKVLEENPMLDGRLVEDLQLAQGNTTLDHKLDRLPVGFLVVGSDDGRLIGSERQIVNLNEARTNAADTFAGTLTHPFMIMPSDSVLIDVKLAAQNVGAGGAFYDLYWWRGAVDQGTTLLAPVGIAAAMTAYTGSIVTSNFSENDMLHFRVQGGGSATINGTITLEFESGVFCASWDTRRMTLTSGSAVNVNLWVF